ncbi:MAG: hypothetical protein Q8Q52_02650 [Acidimicrobiia bacterium]|nr:hypothetical protein [Acidimicrobiia bacterium]
MTKSWVTAALLGVLGLVFVGQGLGLIPGSFMTGDSTWAAVGAVMVLVAVGWAWSARRH